MTNPRVIEITVGFFIAVGLAALVMLAMKVSNISAFTDQEGYEISAKFENIGGLKAKAPVAMAGVRIGRVVGVDFDQDSYQAVVRMRISARYDKIPTDTSAGIFTSGVLGESYVGLEPGAEEAVLKEGGQIKMTQSALVLENLIGKFLFEKAATPEPGGNRDAGGDGSP